MRFDDSSDRSIKKMQKTNRKGYCQEEEVCAKKRLPDNGHAFKAQLNPAQRALKVKEPEISAFSKTAGWSARCLTAGTR